MRRQLHALAARIIGHVRRIADDQVVRPEFRGARPRSEVNCDVDVCSRGIGSRALNSARTDVERGDLRRALLACSDRHHTAAGTEVGNPVPVR